MENTVYCIYFNPKDYPGKYVLRAWIDAVPEAACVVKDSLSDIRQQVPPGMLHCPPFPGDDPVIIETWL